MYSVIIPSLGRVKYLNELLHSIFKQSVPPIEIIILLDNDEFCKKAVKNINKRKNCKIIHCKNLNLSQKRNYGASIAETKYVIFSDDDDIWEINKGKLTIKFLQKYKVITHEFSKFGFSAQTPRFLMGKKNKILSLKELIYGANIFGGGSSIAAWREVIITIPFDDNYYFCEDYDWWIKIFLADIKVKYIPTCLVKYRVHNKNMTANIFQIYFFNIKIFNKLFMKSLILAITFIIGYLRTSISLIFKINKILIISLLKKIFKK
mgnify:CR=1 FL=1|tara:strand:- start:258 stop:1046 length:789 start_codon:yes stop_codon:yes gene_type:complete